MTSRAKKAGSGNLLDCAQHHIVVGLGTPLGLPMFEAFVRLLDDHNRRIHQSADGDSDAART